LIPAASLPSQISNKKRAPQWGPFIYQLAAFIASKRLFFGDKKA
jgi:hypothetical protein